MENSGIRLGEHIHTIDRAIDGSQPRAYFENLFVPGEAVLGEVGLGLKYAQVRLNPARFTHRTCWLGLARRGLDIALDRTERRKFFGSPMKELSLAQELIAQSVVHMDAPDAIITKTAALLATDPKAGSGLSSVAKGYCSKAIYRVIHLAIQFCGGDGVSDSVPLALYLNKVRPLRIRDGAIQTHEWALCRRPSARRAAAVEAGEPYSAEMCSELAGVH